MTHFHHSTDRDVNRAWSYTLFTCLVALFSFLPDFAAAAVNIDDVTCNLVEFFQGKPARGLAMMAVIFVGVGTFFGKLAWGLVIAVLVAIFFIFGAAAVVDLVTNDDKSGSSATKCS